MIWEDYYAGIFTSTWINFCCRSRGQVSITRFSYGHKISINANAFISAIILTQLLAATLGFCIGEAIPLELINLFAGVLFIGMGLKTLFEKPDATEEAAVRSYPVNPFWKVFTLYTLGELGDKTQITCIVLASQNKNFLATFLGAVLAMLLANLLSLVIGRIASSKLSLKTIKIVSSILYIGFGIFSLQEFFLK